MLQAIVLGACPILFVFGAMSDLVSYKIPNWVSLGLAALFAVAAVLSGMPLETVGWHTLVCAVALVVGMILFGFNFIGGGDAKMFAACALWMGPNYIVQYCVYFALVGGLFSLTLLFLRRGALPAFTVRVPVLNQLLTPNAGIPYGVALGIGALLVLHDPAFRSIWL